MNTFTRAIVRTPSPSIVNGITSSPAFGVPDYFKALEQHKNYIATLKSCGLDVTVLPPLESFADSCFVEDCALLTEKGAFLTHPGALSRQGEIPFIESTIRSFYSDDQITKMSINATLEAGDVLQVDKHFYIGISVRSNSAGVKQLTAFLTSYGYAATAVELKKMLHLKTGVSYLGQNYFLLAGECIDYPQFENVDKVCVDEDESYAANCILINGTLIMPSGYPKTEQKVQNLQIPIKTVDVSEFRKIDGGLSCLSLRF